MLDRLYAFKHKIDDINLWAGEMSMFATLISRAGSPLANCCGFVDGTFKPMCKPTGGVGGSQLGLQRECWNPHYKGHGLKYQGLILPNGFFGDLYGTDGFKIYGDFAYSAHAGVGWVEGTVLPIAVPLETPAAA